MIRRNREGDPIIEKARQQNAFQGRLDVKRVLKTLFLILNMGRVVTLCAYANDNA